MYVRGGSKLRSGRCLLEEKLLDPGFTCFPIHSYPVINQISAAVDEHRREHVGVNITLVVKVQLVIVFVFLLVILRFTVGILFILLVNGSRFY